MTLAEFRKLFIKTSGRYDLVVDTEDYVDDGANFYIHTGQRLLDSMFEHEGNFGTTELEVSCDQDVAYLKYHLSVKSVGVRVANGGLCPLEYKSNSGIRSSGFPGPGVPMFYSVFKPIKSPLLRTRESKWERLALRVFPAPHDYATLLAKGRISVPLLEDGSYNFWTLEYPESLLSAAMWAIERFHRNRSGMEDHMSAIVTDLRNLDHNWVENTGESRQMEDSWYFRGEGNVRQ